MYLFFHQTFQKRYEGGYSNYLLWPQKENVRILKFNIFMNFSSIFLIFWVRKYQDHKFFFFHMSNRSSDLSFNVYHQKTDFSRFWKWWKSDIWRENSWYFQTFSSEFFEFQDSGSKYLKLCFPLIRTWFGLILSDLEQFENDAYFRKFHTPPKTIRGFCV